jgi:hypothetical protein
MTSAGVHAGASATAIGDAFSRAHGPRVPLHRPQGQDWPLPAKGPALGHGERPERDQRHEANARICLSAKKMRSRLVTRAIDVQVEHAALLRLHTCTGLAPGGFAGRQRVSPVSEMLTNQHRDHVRQKRHSQSSLRLPVLTHPLYGAATAFRGSLFHPETTTQETTVDRDVRQHAPARGGMV